MIPFGPQKPPETLADLERVRKLLEEDFHAQCISKSGYAAALSEVCRAFNKHRKRKTQLQHQYDWLQQQQEQWLDLRGNLKFPTYMGFEAKVDMLLEWIRVTGATREQIRKHCPELEILLDLKRPVLLRRFQDLERLREQTKTEATKQ